MSGSERNDALRVFLAERDEPCRQCGYNLRGLTTAVCPECRTELAMQVFAVRAQRRVLTAGAVAISMGASIALSVLGLFVFLTLRSSQRVWFVGWTLGERIANVFVLLSCVAVLVMYVPVRLRIRAGLRNPQFALRGIHATLWMVSMFTVLAVLSLMLVYSVRMLQW